MHVVYCMLSFCSRCSSAAHNTCTPCSLLAGADDARSLARLAIPMTESDFLNLCEERALAGKCGNPLCTNKHAYQAPSHTPKINWATLAMVTVTVEQHWCSKECHAMCAQFAKSLGDAVDRLQVLNRLQASTRVLPIHSSSTNIP